MMLKIIEDVKLKTGVLKKIDGSQCFDSKVFDYFLNAPYDMLPEFQGPPNRKLRGGRGKDHPRYGRFVYAFGKFYKPDYIVEVGTYAGGTAVGWGKAIIENSKGKLISIDNDTYSKGTYPTLTEVNLRKAGLSTLQYELRNGDSRTLVPQVAQELKGKVDIYLVDGDHTYEGAKADILNGLPMVKKGGFLLIHDVDRERRMDEQTPEHPHPVYEAMMDVINNQNYQWCILKFIRKHLAVIRVK